MIAGGGSALLMMKYKVKYENAIHTLIQDVQREETCKNSNITIPINIPRKLHYIITSKGWVTMAKQNNLKKKDLYRKPYFND